MENKQMNAKVETSTLRALDQSHHLHPFTNLKTYSKTGGRIVSRAEHIYIYDSDGNKKRTRCEGKDSLAFDRLQMASGMTQCVRVSSAK